MKEMEHDRHDKVVSEIRGALDREVARRFDSERFAADHARMLERLEMERRMARLRGRSRRAVWSFSRVPVPLQWLGIAASIVAAVAGIRSVYRGWSLPTAPVERIASAPVASEAAPAGSSLDLPPEPQALPLVQPSVVPPAPERKRAPERAAAPETASPVDEPAETPPKVRSDSPPTSTPAATVPERPKRGVLPASEPAVVAAESAGAAAVPPPPSKGGGGLSVTGVPSSVAAPVRVVSQRLLKQGLLADVHEVPQLQATLIGIRERRNPEEAAEDSTRNDPEASGLQSEHPLSAIPESAEGSRGDRATPEESVRAGAGTARGGAFSSRESEGTYYVRAFIGSRDRIADSEGGYLGWAVKAVTLPDREAWGTVKQQLTLQAMFGMRILAIDGAFLPASAGKSDNAGRVVVAAAERVYEINVAGAPAGENPDGHAVSVRVARRYPQPTGGRGLRGIEIPIEVRNGAVALVCIGDPLLSGDREGGASPRIRVLCVAVSPRFADLNPAPELGPFPSSERGHEPPVVIERPEPLYPDEARALGIRGEVVLDLTVLKDGDVFGVHVVSLPSVRNAELLIEPATNAVRRYRFLPARIHGEKVDAVVRTKVRFGME